MCGISGIIGLSDERILKKMLLAIQHRGPDDSGTYTDHYLTMGMNRLAIIDLSAAGHQPMSDESKNFWIVYNGEVYNYKAERKLLEQKGFSFFSNSDTEVVLKMYIAYGKDFLKRLRGMFALAIYDKAQQKVLIARDHLGIKPLLYAQSPQGHLIFASELKAILASGLVPKKINAEALRLLLTFGSVTQPNTMIEGVKMLPAGHLLSIENHAVKIEKYWQLGLDRIQDLRKKSYLEQVEFTKNALEESVRLQNVSDVPIGAFLSGGVDSSLLVALMSKIQGTKIKTFSVGFAAEGQKIDETDDAQKIATFLETDHTRVEITGKDFREHLFQIVKAIDQPSVDGVNAYFVSWAAKKAVTVAISGTGGDEFFAGYPWFALLADYANNPQKKLLSKFTKNFNTKDIDSLVKGKMGFLIEYLRSQSDFVSQYAFKYFIFGASGTASLLSPEIKAQCKNIGTNMGNDLYHADQLSEGTAIERVSALCMHTYTQNQLLRDIDAVSMAHSLEIRVPFIDPIIADTALSLPDISKIENYRLVSQNPNVSYKETGTKRILIDIGRPFLPADMDKQPKRGFGMPFGNWLKNHAWDIVEEVTSENTVKKRGFFNYEYVQKIKKDFQKSPSSNWAYLWLLVLIELWCRENL